MYHLQGTWKLQSFHTWKEVVGHSDSVNKGSIAGAKAQLCAAEDYLGAGPIGTSLNEVTRIAAVAEAEGRGG